MAVFTQCFVIQPLNNILYVRLSVTIKSWCEDEYKCIQFCCKMQCVFVHVLLHNKVCNVQLLLDRSQCEAFAVLGLRCVNWQIFTDVWGQRMKVRHCLLTPRVLRLCSLMKLLCLCSLMKLSSLPEEVLIIINKNLSQ